MRGRRKESRKINGYTYKVTQLGALASSASIPRLTKYVGALFSGKGTTLEIHGHKITLDLQGALAQLSEADLEHFRDLFAPLTEVTGPGLREASLELNFDDHFADDLGAMVQWLAFCFELNFASVFRGWMQHAKSKQPASTDDAPSPEASE